MKHQASRLIISGLAAAVVAAISGFVSWALSLSTLPPDTYGSILFIPIATFVVVFVLIWLFAKRNRRRKETNRLSKRREAEEGVSLVARNNANVNLSSYQSEFNYDLAGNRTLDLLHNPQLPGPQGTAHSYTPNELNQLTTVTLRANGVTFGTEPMSYDNNGNMIADAANKAFEWDAANRLSAINYLDTGARSEFGYDGLGRRVKITEYGAGVTATVQPEGSHYVAFSTAPFRLPLGNYLLTLEAVESSGQEVSSSGPSMALLIRCD